MIFLKRNKTRKKSFYFRTQWCTVSAHYTWEIIKNSRCYHSCLLYCILNTCDTGEIFMNSNPWTSSFFPFFEFQSQINEFWITKHIRVYPLKIKKTKEIRFKKNLQLIKKIPKYLNLWNYFAKLFTNISKAIYLLFFFIYFHTRSPPNFLHFESRTYPISKATPFVSSSIFNQLHPPLEESLKTFPFDGDDQSHGDRVTMPWDKF